MTDPPSQASPDERGPGSGRERELRAIEAESAAALASGARAVLLTGDPGIGKSWVLARAAERLEQAGDTRLLRGYALELQGTPPHYPLGRAFSAVLRAWPDTESQEARAILASAGIGHATPELPEPPPIAPEAAQLRVFDALADVCSALASRQPLVLILDDMQWAASFTWDAVQYLLRTLGDVPVLVLLAARDEVMLEPGSDAARVIAELQRLRLLTHLPLHALPREAIAELSSVRLGGAISDELSTLLAARSEGNPFFAEEILHAYREQGLLVRRGPAWHIADEAAGTAPAMPATLHLAIGVRLARLPEGCEEALTAGAVLGRTFAARTLASMLDCEINEVGVRVRPAELAGLVHPEQGAWRFRHDTVREALLGRHVASMPGLHAAAANALTLTGGYAPGFENLTALAHHWGLAQLPAKAGPAALAAARAATSAHAIGEALVYARSAHEMCEAARDELPDAMLAEAARAHGDSALATGAYTEAAEAYRALQQLARRTDDGRLEGTAWLRLGNALRRQELPAEAAACYAEALRRLDEQEQAAEVADVQIALCDLEGLTRARYAEAREAGDRALALARRLDDRGIEARATLALANAETRAGDAATARSLFVGALDHALAADDVVLAAEISGGLSNACYFAGEIRQSRTYAEQRLQLARRSADPFALRHAHSWLALVAATQGDWDEARQLLDESERALGGLDNPEPMAFLRFVRAVIAFRVGALDEAYVHLRGALTTFEQLGDETALWYAGVLAQVCIALGRADEARALVAAQERRLASIDESALPARSARCVLALIYATWEDREAGARCEAVLERYAGDLHMSPARLSLAALAALRGDETTALEHLAAVEAQARAEGLGPDLAVALLERARLSPADSRAPILDEARTLLERLGMQRELASAGTLMQPSAPAGASPAGLSAREVEVLRLIAQGMTNREVASTLVISERTVANHLSHIFDKIEVDNRASAAAFAFRNQLV